jgi:hypothetical protein
MTPASCIWPGVDLDGSAFSKSNYTSLLYLHAFATLICKAEISECDVVTARFGWGPACRVLASVYPS